MSVGAFRACPDHKDYRTGVCLPCEIDRLQAELSAARFGEREWRSKTHELIAERETTRLETP